MFSNIFKENSNINIFSKNACIFLVNLILLNQLIQFNARKLRNKFFLLQNKLFRQNNRIQIRINNKSIIVSLFFSTHAHSNSLDFVKSTSLANTSLFLFTLILKN